MSILLLDRLMVHYEVLGRGRPVLFLHTWVGSWRYWIPAMQVASVSFRAYALDLWGYGDSAKEPVRFGIEHQLALLDSFLEQMGILRLALVGHGLGAVIALQYAATHPEQVDRVMAVSLPLENGMLTPRFRSSDLTETLDWIIERSPRADAVRMEAPKADPRTFGETLKSLALMSLTPLWKETRRPCLLLHGINDPAVLPPRSDHYPDLPYLIHSVLFDQSGHFPMIEEDSRFNRLLADFLALPSGDSPRDLQVKEEWKRRVR